MSNKENQRPILMTRRQMLLTTIAGGSGLLTLFNGCGKAHYEQEVSVVQKTDPADEKPAADSEIKYTERDVFENDSPLMQACPGIVKDFNQNNGLELQITEKQFIQIFNYCSQQMQAMSFGFLADQINGGITPPKKTQLPAEILREEKFNGNFHTVSLALPADSLLYLSSGRSKLILSEPQSRTTKDYSFYNKNLNFGNQRFIPLAKQKNQQLVNLIIVNNMGGKDKLVQIEEFFTNDTNIDNTNNFYVTVGKTTNDQKGFNPLWFYQQLIYASLFGDKVKIYDLNVRESRKWQKKSLILDLGPIQQLLFNQPR